jgi:hypothetical protein
VPLAYFEQNKWQLHPYGHYAGPISIFANRYQPGMARLFSHAQPIDFGIGYKWRTPNLLAAVNTFRRRSRPSRLRLQLRRRSPKDPLLKMCPTSLPTSLAASAGKPKPATKHTPRTRSGRRAYSMRPHGRSGGRFGGECTLSKCLSNTDDGHSTGGTERPMQNWLHPRERASWAGSPAQEPWQSRRRKDAAFTQQSPVNVILILFVAALGAFHQ